MILSEYKLPFQRAESLPRLFKGDLLEELGMEEAGGRRTAMSMTGLEDSRDGDRTNKSKVLNSKFVILKAKESNARCCVFVMASSLPATG